MGDTGSPVGYSDPPPPRARENTSSGTHPFGVQWLRASRPAMGR